MTPKSLSSSLKLFSYFSISHLFRIYHFPTAGNNHNNIAAYNNGKNHTNQVTQDHKWTQEPLDFSENGKGVLFGNQDKRHSNTSGAAGVSPPEQGLSSTDTMSPDAMFQHLMRIGGIPQGANSPLSKAQATNLQHLLNQYYYVALKLWYQMQYASNEQQHSQETTTTTNYQAAHHPSTTASSNQHNEEHLLSLLDRYLNNLAEFHFQADLPCDQVHSDVMLLLHALYKAHKGFSCLHLQSLNNHKLSHIVSKIIHYSKYRYSSDHLNMSDPFHSILKSIASVNPQVMIDMDWDSMQWERPHEKPILREEPASASASKATSQVSSPFTHVNASSRADNSSHTSGKSTNVNRSQKDHTRKKKQQTPTKDKSFKLSSELLNKLSDIAADTHDQKPHAEAFTQTTTQVPPEHLSNDLDEEWITIPDEDIIPGEPAAPVQDKTPLVDSPPHVQTAPDQKPASDDAYSTATKPALAEKSPDIKTPKKPESQQKTSAKSDSSSIEEPPSKTDNQTGEPPLEKQSSQLSDFEQLDLIYEKLSTSKDHSDFFKSIVFDEGVKTAITYFKSKDLGAYEESCLWSLSKSVFSVSKQDFLSLVQYMMEERKHILTEMRVRLFRSVYKNLASVNANQAKRFAVRVVEAKTNDENRDNMKKIQTTIMQSSSKQVDSTLLNYILKQLYK